MAGDIRGEGAAILQQLWDTLGWPYDVSERAGVVTRYGVMSFFSCLSYLSTHLFIGISDIFELPRQPCGQSMCQPS